jgi:hypothetical protein
MSLLAQAMKCFILKQSRWQIDEIVNNAKKEMAYWTKLSIPVKNYIQIQDSCPHNFL